MCMSLPPPAAGREGAELIADLQGAFIRGANLKRTTLQGANLQGANLEGADLLSADVENAIFASTKLYGTL